MENHIHKTLKIKHMSLIAYFGGKSSKVFREFINSRIPEDGIKTYLEPFSGAMGTYMDDPNLNSTQLFITIGISTRRIYSIVVHILKSFYQY